MGGTASSERTARPPIPVAAPPRGHRTVPALLYAVPPLLLVATLVVWIVSARGGEASTIGPSKAALTAFEEETGIQITRVSLIGGGGIVDLRYRVVDPDKAIVVHDDETEPILVNEVSGVVVDDYFHAHSGKGTAEPDFAAGAYYALLYSNHGEALASGETVTVLVGDARLEHVRID